MAVDLGAVSPSAALCRRRGICSRRRVDGRMELSRVALFVTRVRWRKAGLLGYPSSVLL